MSIDIRTLKGLTWDIATKTVRETIIDVPNELIAKYLADNATPPPPTKDELKAAKAAEKAKKGKATEDEQEDDTPTVTEKGSNKSAVTSPVNSADEEAENADEQEQDATDAEGGDDDTPAVAAKPSIAALVDDED